MEYDNAGTAPPDTSGTGEKKAKISFEIEEDLLRKLPAEHRGYYCRKAIAEYCANQGGDLEDWLADRYDIRMF